MDQKANHRGSAGRIAEEKIRSKPPRIPQEIIDRYLALGDLSSTVSDVLDSLGVVGALGSSILKPTLPEKRVVGMAITVRNAPQPLSVQETIQTRSNYMTEIEGMHQADPGDVLVIQGLRDVSNMGGVMATTAHYQKLAAAVVDGGVRDVGHSRSLGFPVWSRDISPITGKWRAVTQEINGPVTIAGVTVHAGDLVIADETGICFVPARLVEQVLESCEAIHAKEEGWIEGLKQGMSIPELVKKIY
jgi:4-hydroxy-4-methyl-2-oxoglutarate aldolase